jgi:5-methylcytosine-specific restriction protein A
MSKLRPKSMADWPYNTKTWQRLRRLKLSSEPLCEGCAEMGTVTPANTVDHKTPISQGGDPFPPLDQLASYCASCHSAKTVRGTEAGAVRTRKPRRGCNVDGSPIDPNHPWNPRSTKASDIDGKSLRALGAGPSLLPNLELVSFPQNRRKRRN